MREGKTCFRFFGGFLQAQENWLNRMAGRGYRLVSVGKLGYRFQTCPPDTVEDRVEWIGHKSSQDARAYQQFLEELGYRVWVKNVNLNCSVGKIRFRPWADPGGKLAGNRSTFNRELLLVERERDGTPFQLHTTFGDQARYYRRLRDPWLTVFLLFGLAALWRGSLVFGALALAAAVPTALYQGRALALGRRARIEES